MYGYFTSYGYVGYVYGRKMLFANEDEYYEYVEELDDAEM